jgi:hypothetical protein
MLLRFFFAEYIMLTTIATTTLLCSMLYMRVGILLRSKTLLHGRLETGESQNAVAARYNVHRNMISRFGNATSSQVRQMMVHVLDVPASQIP